MTLYNINYKCLIDAEKTKCNNYKITTRKPYREA